MVRAPAGRQSQKRRHQEKEEKEKQINYLSICNCSDNYLARRMKRNSEFHDHIVYDILGAISGITSKAMFGGYGIYKNGKIFAIIIDGELYFKVGENTVADFKKLGSRQFTYKKKDGKKYKMSYWLLPEEIMEDKEKLELWVDSACRVGV